MFFSFKIIKNACIFKNICFYLQYLVKFVYFLSENFLSENFTYQIIIITKLYK